MEKILIHKGKPSKVFEKDETHYFYWPVELGFTYWRLGKYRIPIFPIKVKDYEPIKS